MKRILILAVAFIVLIGIALLLFSAGKTQGQSQQPLPYTTAESQSFYESSQRDVPNSTSPLQAAAHSRSEIAVLDNDLDHDGNYDSISDPLVALVLILVVLSMRFILSPVIGGTLFLTLCEPSKLSSIWPLVLERPG